MLCREGDLSPTVRDLVERARELGIPILGESEREMRRMSSGETVPELIALEGSGGNATLDELMSSDGLVCVLIGLRYPGNVGFIIRSAEVAGLAGIVVTTDWEGSQLSEALRVGMRADRFFPVIESDAGAAIAAARRAGRRVVALETTGTKAPWHTDLSLPTALVVGSETTGIPESLLASMDDVVRLPTHGFIPSYNVQAAVGMLLGEWLRQNQA
jgi:TrmH family RNA methyltransferase